MLGRAVIDLRARLKWSQADLARQIHRRTKQKNEQLPEVHQETVSRWERGAQMPSITYRLALAKIATAHDHHDLTAAFRASPDAWHLVSVVLTLGIADED